MTGRARGEMLARVIGPRSRAEPLWAATCVLWSAMRMIPT